jgi:hypothetical protein
VLEGDLLGGRVVEQVVASCCVKKKHTRYTAGHHYIQRMQLNNSEYGERELLLFYVWQYDFNVLLISDILANIDSILQCVQHIDTIVRIVCRIDTIGSIVGHIHSIALTVGCIDSIALIVGRIVSVVSIFCCIDRITNIIHRIDGVYVY